MTKEEFIKAIKEKEVCKDGVRFCLKKETYEEIVQSAPTGYFVWAIINGFTDFEVRLSEKGKYGDNGCHAVRLLQANSRFLEFINLDELSGYWIAELLATNPEYISMCDLNKLNQTDKNFIIKRQPQLKGELK